MNQINYNEYTNDEISLSEITGVIKPYIVHIILVGIVFLMGGFLFTKIFVDPVYESNATLIVNNRKDESTDAITSDEITSAKNLAAVYSIIIKSDAVLKPVIANTNSDVATSTLANSVKVSAVDNTQVIRISVKDTNPERAYNYTKEIVNVAPDIIIDMVEAGSVRVVANPQMPLSPVSPNAMMNSLIACILGILLASGVVLVSHVLDRTVRSPEDIEKLLGVPVIGIIPNVDNVKQGGK